jgi:diadenylate cyclase
MKDLLRLFRWQDALDIVLLSFVFYRLYLRLRRKRALRMILAIVALPFFYILAQWIDLPLSVWALQNLWAVILLVLVVIFQQEIREVLGSITLPTFLFGKPERFPSERLDTIADAAFNMAEKRIGGLIVLQRRDDLGEFIHGETPLNSEINGDLLLSIFIPQSPLHDGAVIIQGDRIRYATALLPVSQSLSHPKEWGTRHRAGAGITESADAECIIISEERGEVLLAHGGKIARIGEKEALRKSLSSFPEGKDSGKGGLRGFYNALPTKALFFVLVCLLWGFVIGVRQGEISFNIPLEYYSIPQRLEIKGTPAKEVNVRLRGSQRLLSSIAPDHLRVQVDLKEAHAGMNEISLSKKNINVPSGISVTYFYPRNIRLELSPIADGKKRP